MQPLAIPPAGPARGGRFQTGDWLAEPDLNQLRRSTGAGVVRVEPKVMEVLVYLASRQGRTIGRRELLDAVWGERFVVEGVLTRCVFELRQALGDDPRDPRYIQTVPKKGYRWLAPVVTEGRPAAAVPPLAPADHTIAVLPFDNLSADLEQEYFCEGMAEELINALGRLEGLRVVARTSSFRFKGRVVDLERVARELGVQTVLEGSVRKAGDRLRINVQLVDVAAGVQLWSQRFDRELADVFSVQDEIAARIAAALGPRLVGAARSGEPRPRRPTVDLEAYQLYLKGRYHWNKRHEGGLQEGLRAFQRAVAIDPRYAAAHAGIADSYALLASWFFDVLPEREAMALAKASALRALELDPSLAAAHSSLGWIRMHHDWAWEDAERDFQRALELEPERAATYHWYSFLLSVLGRYPEALAAAQRGWELDPLALIVNANLAQPHYYARRLEQVIAESERLARFEPEFPVSYQWLGATYAVTENWPAATAAFERYVALFGRTPRSVAMLGYVAARSGDRAGAEQALAELGRESGTRPPAAIHLAIVHLGLGEIDESFAWLERAYAQRSGLMPYLAVEPLFDPLRGDPRFDSLLRRLRLDRVRP